MNVVKTEPEVPKKRRGRPTNQPAPVIGYCPKTEPDEVRAKWKAIFPGMRDYLAPTDRQIFLEICRMLVERENDYKMIREKGCYYSNDKGEPRTAPWATRFDKTGDMLLKYFARLALSPTDRRRMLANASKNTQPDEVEKADGYTGLEDEGI